MLAGPATRMSALEPAVARRHVPLTHSTQTPHLSLMIGSCRVWRAAFASTSARRHRTLLNPPPLWEVTMWPTLPRLVGALSPLPILLACASGGAQANVITAPELSRSSAANAYDAIRRVRPEM